MYVRNRLTIEIFTLFKYLFELSMRHMIWICIPSTDYLCSDVYRLKRAFQKLSPYYYCPAGLHTQEAHPHREAAGAALYKQLRKLSDCGLGSRP